MSLHHSRSRSLALGLAALFAVVPLAARAEGEVRARAATFARQNNRTAVAPELLRRVRQRPVVKIRSPQEAGRYADALGNSFEVIFRPDASEHGHIHLRAGNMVYDLGNVRFARATPVTRAHWLSRGCFGFCFQSDAQTIRRMQQVYGDKVRKIHTGELQFQMRPWQTNPPRGQNCETFITSTLHELVPSLGLYGVREYRGAVGLARWCLASPKTQAVTIYSSGDPAASPGFRFRKLE